MAPATMAVTVARGATTGLTLPAAIAMPVMASSRSPGANGSGTPASSRNSRAQMAASSVTPSRAWSQASRFKGCVDGTGAAPAAGRRAGEAWRRPSGAAGRDRFGQPAEDQDGDVVGGPVGRRGQQLLHRLARPPGLL